MMIKNSTLEFDFLRDWTNLAPNLSAVQKIKELVRLHLLQKAALKIELTTQFIDPPEGKIRMDWDAFLRTACEHELDSLIFEYCQIAAKKNQTVPLNLILDFIHYAEKNTDYAEIIINCLGECAWFILKMNPKWTYLHPHSKSDIIQLKDNKKQILLWKKLFKEDENIALNYYVKHLADWSEKVSSTILDELKFANFIIPDETIEILNTQLKGKLKWNIYPILFLQDQLKEDFEFAPLVLQIIESGKYENLASKKIFIFHSKIDLSKAISLLPPIYLQQLKTCSHFLDYLKQNNCLVSLSDAIQIYKDQKAALIFSKYLIDSELFNEDFPVESLSKMMDHMSFNSIAIYFLQKMKENADLEAFLFFIKPFKHFWSDELVHEVLQMFKNKSLKDKFNLEVFYDYLAYRMNPNSRLEMELPNEIKNHIEYPLSYSSIIHFRKVLRR